MNRRTGTPIPAAYSRLLGTGLTALLLFAATGCDDARGEAAEIPAFTAEAASAAPAGHAHHASDHANSLAMEAGELSDYSIYHLESEWWDQHGQNRTLETLAGRVQVVAMVYTHCSYTCPKILMDMKRIEAQVAETHPIGAGFVLVSIDPKRDTPDRLRSFAEATRLDTERWTLLSGSDGDILELATMLGIKYRQEGENDWSHSNAMLVLDPAGEIVFRQLGLGEDVQPMIDAIRKALPAG
jgi:protein SCO1